MKDVLSLFLHILRYKNAGVYTKVILVLFYVMLPLYLTARINLDEIFKGSKDRITFNETATLVVLEMQRLETRWAIESILYRSLK